MRRRDPWALVLEGFGGVAAAARARLADIGHRLDTVEAKRAAVSLWKAQEPVAADELMVDPLGWLAQDLCDRLDRMIAFVENQPPRRRRTKR